MSLVLQRQVRCEEAPFCRGFTRCNLQKKLHLLEFAGSDFLTDTLGGV